MSRLRWSNGEQVTGRYTYQSDQSGSSYNPGCEPYRDNKKKGLEGPSITFEEVCKRFSTKPEYLKRALELRGVTIQSPEQKIRARDYIALRHKFSAAIRPFVGPRELDPWQLRFVRNMQKRFGKIRVLKKPRK